MGKNFALGMYCHLRRVAFQEQRERHADNCRRWITKHPAQRRKSARDWARRNMYRLVARYHLDPVFHIKEKLRRHILSAISGRAKLGATYHLLGCSISEYVKYLEALFPPGMSWDNRAAWHIDHKIPICKFDLTILEGQKSAFHYTNTQPLWAVDNLRKGGRLVCP